LVMDSIGQVGCTYYMFSAIRDLKLKRINFPNVYRKIESFLKENVAFYLGCMLWAAYISGCKNCQIEGNMLLGENATEEEYTSEINFLIGFLEKDLPRDCKYYLNKPYHPDEKYLTILKAYKEFLIINKGFVECENTDKILLPQNFKPQDEKTLEQINNIIQKAIENRNITELLEYFDMLF